MNDDDPERTLLRRVADLVEREHSLRDLLSEHEGGDRITARGELHRLEVELDQCWDLLRQRRALRAVRLDPGTAHLRPPDQVENYLPRPGGPQ